MRIMKAPRWRSSTLDAVKLWERLRRAQGGDSQVLVGKELNVIVDETNFQDQKHC